MRDLLEESVLCTKNVTWSFKNHYNMLFCCSRTISVENSCVA